MFLCTNKKFIILSTTKIKEYTSSTDCLGKLVGFMSSLSPFFKQELSFELTSFVIDACRMCDVSSQLHK